MAMNFNLWKMLNSVNYKAIKTKNLHLLIYLIELQKYFITQKLIKAALSFIKNIIKIIASNK